MGFLNIAYLTIKIYQIDQAGDAVVFVKGVLYEDQGPTDYLTVETAKSNYQLELLEAMLIVVSFINAFVLFAFQYKQVILFKQPTSCLFPDSTFCTGIASYLSSIDWDLEKKSRNARLVVIRVNEDRLTWIMNVWNPSQGSLRMFTFFSPAQVLLMYLSSHQGHGALLFVAYFTSISVIDSLTAVLFSNRYVPTECCR